MTASKWVAWFDTPRQELVKGEVIRLDMQAYCGEPAGSFLYGVVSLGNGTRKGAMGVSIFVDNVSTVLEDCETKTSKRADRWERCRAIQVRVEP